MVRDLFGDWNKELKNFVCTYQDAKYLMDTGNSWQARMPVHHLLFIIWFLYNILALK